MAIDKKQVDAEQLVDNLQNAKFGLSIQNIVAIVIISIIITSSQVGILLQVE